MHGLATLIVLIHINIIDNGNPNINETPVFVCSKLCYL